MTPPVDRSGLPHVLVVGGGFGGVAAAQGLRGAACRVTMVDQLNHHVFQPLLYQVATASLSPADIATPIRALLRRLVEWLWAYLTFRRGTRVITGR